MSKDNADLPEPPHDSDKPENETSTANQPAEETEVVLTETVTTETNIETTVVETGSTGDGEVQVIQAASDEWVMSEWWRRVVALIVDNLIIFAFSLIPFFLLLLSAGSLISTDSDNNDFESFTNGSNPDSSASELIAFILLILFAMIFIAVFYFLIASLYFGFTMMRKGEHNGQSWGKQMLGITVVRENRTPVGFWFTILRQIVVIQIVFGICLQLVWAIVTGVLVPVLSALPAALMLDYLWPLWDEKKQALHDKMVSTRVIKI